MKASDIWIGGDYACQEYKWGSVFKATVVATKQPRSGSSRQDGVRVKREDSERVITSRGVLMPWPEYVIQQAERLRKQEEAERQRKIAKERIQAANRVKIAKLAEVPALANLSRQRGFGKEVTLREFFESRSDLANPDVYLSLDELVKLAERLTK